MSGILPVCQFARKYTSSLVRILNIVFEIPEPEPEIL